MPDRRASNPRLHSASEHNIDVILQDQDVCQRHHPDEQNRKKECYGEDPTDDFDEEQHNIQSLSLA